MSANIDSVWSEVMKAEEAFPDSPDAIARSIDNWAVASSSLTASALSA